MLKNAIAGILLVLSMLSCTKDELTRPVQAELVLEIVENDVASKKDLLEVEGGRMIISELEFKGYRENGENYFFTRKFPDSLKVNFSIKTTTPILTFEMPQGLYNKIELSLGISTKKKVKPVGNDIDRAELTGGVELWGTYIDTHGKVLPFVFIYTDVNALKYTAASPDGDQQVMIKDKSNYKARLQFDPLQWMNLINPRMLQSAKLNQLEGVPTILITENHNTHIYKLLASRIEKSATLNIE